jgi:hypothetical protein
MAGSQVGVVVSTAQCTDFSGTTVFNNMQRQWGICATALYEGKLGAVWIGETYFRVASMSLSCTVVEMKSGAKTLEDRGW